MYVNLNIYPYLPSYKMMLYGEKFYLLHSTLLSIFMSTYPLYTDPTCPAHRKLTTRTREGNWKHVSRELKTDWGKGCAVERTRHAWMGEYWSWGRVNRIMETLPEWSE